MMQGDILLASRKALLKRVTPNLRSVIVEHEKLPLVVFFYYNQEPSIIEKELIQSSYKELKELLKVDMHLRIIIGNIPLPQWTLRVYERYG